MSNHSSLLNGMALAAEAAGKQMIRDFGEVEQLQVAMKLPGDFVTKTDKMAEEILREHLERLRPKYGFLLEEGGVVENKDHSNRWIVDPLDGTHNFMHGLPMFCISIALERDSKPYAGVIYNPVSDQMWLAEKGQGAWMQNRRLRVSKRRDLISSLIYTEMPRAHHVARENMLKRATVLSKFAGQTRDFGSSALALAYFASGQFDAVFLENIQPWDIAAGAIIASEAGGFVRDFDGETDMLQKGHVIATNGNVDKELHRLMEKFDMPLPMLLGQ